MRLKNYLYTLNRSAAVLLVMLIAVGCANVVPPDGGPKDTTPPVLLSQSPKDSLLNVRPKKITLRFDKFMEIKDLNKNMQVSPLLDIDPTVISYGKKIEITIIDSLLRPNTTYKLQLGNALTDNREYTPLADYSYIFSTGSYFDTLVYEGRVVNALTGMPDTGITVMFYDTTVSDTAIMRKKPIYAAKTDSRGTFMFDMLPAGPFKLVAIGDEDNNYMYSPRKERIAFTETIVYPEQSKSLDATLYSFVEVATDATDTAKSTTTTNDTQSGMGARPKKNKDEASIQYTVFADTTTTTQRTFDITRPLIIHLQDSTVTIDKDRVFLSYDAGGIDAQAITEITRKGDSLILETQWVENKIYTLRLIKSWATDTANVEYLPGKYIFRTKGKEDYSTLSINFNDSLQHSDYFVYVSSGKDTTYFGKIEPEIYLDFLKPETYNIWIFKDTNKDGKWTTGNYLERVQPELMIPHEGSVMLRSGWENEIDFKPYTIKTGTGMRGSGEKQTEDTNNNLIKE